MRGLRTPGSSVLRAAGAILFLSLLAAGPSGAQQAAPTAEALRGPEPETVLVTAPRANTDYRFGPNDKLRVTVFGEDDLSGAFEVDSLGFVRLPLIGQIKAEGLTAHELEARVARALDDGYLNDARVAIEVTTYRPFYIIGQVTKPGEYPYASNMTAMDAVALAGGFTEKAVESTLYVRHEGDTDEHAVSADQITSVRPGDVIRVPETTFWSVIDVISPLSGLGYIVAATTG